MVSTRGEPEDRGGATPQSAISKLIKLLADEQQFNGTEIAETLWLAMRIEPVDELTPLPPAEKPKRSPPPPVTPGEDTEDRSSAAEDNRPAPRASVETAAPQAGVLPTKALPVWIADPSMLRDPLAVMRALKPLLLRGGAGMGRLLDESATVDKIARTGLWLPILAAENEPWFDLILVVDRGSSMHLWQRLVDDLVLVFQQYGAFRNLQVFEMVVTADSTADAVRLKTQSGRRGHRPSELIDPQGRRIAIVLSDCAGAYWWNGQLRPMLQAWADAMPTVVWQMLPEWMWSRTALGRGKAVALSNGTPGAANQQLQPLEIGLDEFSASELKLAPIPVVTSDPSDLNNWSLMLMGDRRERTPGFLLPQFGGQVPKSKSLEEMAQDTMRREGIPLEDEALQQQIEKIASGRIQRFLQMSSPQARRLVMLLAAAPVITLPVMRLIRDSMMPDERSPLPVAEVFLSGLLQRISEPPLPNQPRHQAQLQLDRVQYDFVPKVRDLLLKVLPAFDKLDVINSVSAAVEARWTAAANSNQSFRAFLTDPQAREPEGFAGMRSFASITADILEPLCDLYGDEYRQFVQALRQGATGASRDSELEDDFKVPDLRILEFFRAEVREERPPVQLVMDEFTVATVEIKELEDRDGRELVEFEFEVARVVRQRFSFRVGAAGRTGWRVERDRRSAYQFIEPLDEAAGLEMVAIPAGTFMMGSPESEPGRFGDESPQHEVSVTAFFMGKYPITQAQWRFVAGMEQINRALDPDPSRFKGDERPVESVSWDEAVEFCDRLSHRTGNDYQLPTEAQWEYACRAGTTTPFHFGDTILPELANYDCTESYSGGTKGEFRRETTPVDEFGIANAFGLCDVHGNVWEWCADHWHNSYEGAPTDGSAWVTSGKVTERVIRGGSWSNYPRICRSAARYLNTPDIRNDRFGFRVCCRAPRTLQPPTG
ncbi:MAG: formylglycine-generating enzyme family protein [Phormidesmis sp.]